MKFPEIRVVVVLCFLTGALVAMTGHYVYAGLKNIPAFISSKFAINNIPEASADLAANPYDITIVTLYVKVGRFQKGTGTYYYDPSMYRTWMTSWGMLTNRVIGFFEDDETLEYFKNIRSRQPPDKSVLIKIDRKDIPAFKYLERIKEIFQQPGYPKHPPNTVVPEYSAATYSKYDVLQMAIEKGLVHTKNIAWLDIGLFRDLVNDIKKSALGNFTLEVPDDFNSSCVSMAEITARSQVLKWSPKDYVYKNLVWVAGGFTLGTKENMWKFANSYRIMYKELLDQNLSSTDQQVIGSMYSPDYIKQQKVDMQTYRCWDGHYNSWFCLAYICKEAAEKRRALNGTGITTPKNLA